MMGVGQQPAVYSQTEVAAHNTAKSLWISVAGKVYDVSEFLFDHPGGEEFILQYAGQDVTHVMKDELEHLHSDTAYEILDQYYIGDLAPTTTEESEGLKRRGNG
ncbi:fatty acid alpha-hydroxylase, partial [Borealophlyctis nickersoniae]